MLFTTDIKRIGGIGNYYGGLVTMEYLGKYYWLIENYDTKLEDLNEWEEIDKELFDKLIAHNLAKPDQ